MANKIQLKRGVKANLPTLNVAEPGFCTDTGDFYIGSSSGNIGFIKKDELFTNAKDNGLIGNGSTNDYAALNTLLTSIGNNKTDLYLPKGTYIIGSNITLPSNINLIFATGAMLSPSTGITITLNCEINAPLNQIFTGSGIVVGKPRVKSVFPEWFGAKGDGVTNDTSAIQKALNLAEQNGLTVFLNAVQYGYLIDNLTIPGRVSLIGSGRNPVNSPYLTNDNIGSTLLITSLTNPGLIMTGSNKLTGLRFFYPNQTDTNPPITYPACIKLLYGAGDILMEDCIIVNAYYAIDARELHQRLQIRNCNIWSLNMGIEINEGTDVDRLENIQIWPFWMRNGVGTSLEYSTLHGIAIKLTRADNIILDGIFVIHQSIGLSLNGSCYGIVSNSAFESCGVGIHINDTNDENGFQFDNCKFNIAPDVPFITAGYCVLTNGTASGNILMENCSFWGGGENHIHNVFIQSSGLKLNMSNCSMYKVKSNSSFVKLNCSGDVSINNSFFGGVSSGGFHVDINGVTGNIGIIMAYNRCAGGLIAYNPNAKPIIGISTNVDLN